MKYTLVDEKIMQSLSLLKNEKFDEAYQNDTHIVEDIMYQQQHITNHNILRLSKYLGVLGRVGLYQNDLAVENKSIIIFTELFEFIKHYVTEYGKLSQDAFMQYGIELILANIKIKRMETANKLIKTIYKQADAINMGTLFVRILTDTSGSLKQKYIDEWVYKIGKNYVHELLKKVTNEPLTSYKIEHYDSINIRFLYRVYSICRRLNIEPLEEYFTASQHFYRKYHGRYIKNIYLMSNEITQYFGNKEYVLKWVSSQKRKKLPEKQKKNYDYLHELIDFNDGKTTIIKHTVSNDYLQKRQKENVKKYLNRISNSKDIPMKVKYSLFEKQYKYVYNKIYRTIRVSERLKNLSDLYFIKHQLRYWSFWQKFDETIKKIPQPAESQRVYFFVNDYSLVNGTQALPLLLEAKRNGYIVMPTSPRTFDVEPTSYKELNKLAGSMHNDRDIDIIQNAEELQRNWKMDLANKQISYKNYNIYQPIYEFVSRYQFTYFLNYETDAFTKAKVHTLIKYLNRIFLYCEQIEKWAIKHKKAVRFVSNAPHFPHAAGYRIYCEVRGYKHNLNYIVLSHGYDNYFKNIGDAQTETLTALNLTTNPYSRNSFLGTKAEFERFYQRNIQRIDMYRTIAKEWMQWNRSVMTVGVDSKRKQEILAKVKKYKKAKKQIYLLNGKVVFDLCVKYTQGTCHDDMSHWLTHTVETIAKNPDILLLIKPHPHEMRKDLTMTSETTITLKNLIKTELVANTIYLDSNMFTINELVDYIDLGILWNGTSALEFAAQKIKTVVCDVWGHYDYPIGFIKCDTLKMYEQFLNNPHTLAHNDDIQDKAIMFLNYMGSDVLNVKNPYTKTSTLNYFQFYNSQIFSEEIDEYIQNGDENLSILFYKLDDYLESEMTTIEKLRFSRKNLVELTSFIQQIKEFLVGILEKNLANNKQEKLKSRKNPVQKQTYLELIRQNIKIESSILKKIELAVEQEHWQAIINLLEQSISGYIEPSDYLISLDDKQKYQQNIFDLQVSITSLEQLENQLRYSLENEHYSGFSNYIQKVKKCFLSSVLVR